MALYALHLSPTATSAEDFTFHVGEYADISQYVPYLDTVDGDAFAAGLAGQTRLSGVIQLDAVDDHEAWNELVSLYEEMVDGGHADPDRACTVDRRSPFAITSAWTIDARLEMDLATGELHRVGDWDSHLRQSAGAA